MKKGRFTIPTDENYVEGTKVIAEKWGADAVRDCDGTSLPKNAKELAEKVYNTYFVVRGDNAWAENHLDELQNVLLMSERVTAFETEIKIDLLKGYYKEQLKVNPENPKKYWQVFDRTVGKEIFDWEYDNNSSVIIKNVVPFHEYTVNFFAFNIWDSTQMYNYITNNWTGEKHLVMEPRFKATFEHIKENLEKWCDENEDVNVVRFTTFLYHFFLVFNEMGKEKHVDWFGYPMTASPRAFDSFKEKYGYEIKSEDIIDNGTYHNNFVNPTKAFNDYMELIEEYVSVTVRELVDIVHSKGKESMMFLGDSWIGTEPYGEHFKDMNIDAVVGSIGGGVTVRMLSEIPFVKYHEGRFLPYFFPDTFFEGNENNAIAELNKNWLTARRAIMRKPLDRIGFGGYLSLAAKFPNFVERVSEVADEFRTIYENIDNKKPYSRLKVGLLNAWGKKRSWMSHMVAHELWYQQIYSYQGILESISGLPVDIEFLSFEDVKEGVPKDFNALINAGDAYTAFSGGTEWLDEKLQTSIRSFVYNGGGFIGIGEPTACSTKGRYFQLADILGVDREIGFTLSEDKYNVTKKEHFITEGYETFDYGEDKKNIYALENATVLDIKFSNRFNRSVNVGEVKMAVNNYGKGKSFYITGLPYSFENARLLYKALCFVSNKDINVCFSTNINTDCNFYPSSKKYAILNNSNFVQKTNFYDLNGDSYSLTLNPMEIKWIQSNKD